MFFKLLSPISRIIIFILFFFILKFLIDTTLPRFYSLINYLPFIYLLLAIPSGFNITFYSILFMFFGLIAIITGEYNSKLNKYYLLFSSFWIFNASSSYSFKVGKLRGFTSSVYEFNSVLSWTIGVFLIINGLLWINKGFVWIINGIIWNIDGLVWIIVKCRHFRNRNFCAYLLPLQKSVRKYFLDCYYNLLFDWHDILIL